MQYGDENYWDCPRSCRNRPGNMGGYRLSGSFGSQITQAITGSDTDKVMPLYIAGAVSLVVGIFLFIKK